MIKVSIIAIVAAIALSGCAATKPDVRIEYVRPKAPQSLVTPCARKPRPTEEWKMQSNVKRYYDRLEAAHADCLTRADTAQKWIKDNGLVE
ncbi:hypothetical protein ASD54_08635 [Rhizobium sp. Root149]|uniref:Rz1-like lysis system protein LysC n=1 Tax=Rhizobium sp. Root149 TaxID=1736473 RepID=UPI000715B4BC|nr:hypothetical protein [Rhizobium sp. Root149]KQZ50311.1 hypothetical protein ASD54_08635 [Rhizobium sp. Root149]